MRTVQSYGDLRLLDLTAKLSRTKPSVVVAVLRALGAVGDHFSMEKDLLTESLLRQSDNSKPNPSNVAACSQAAADIVVDQGLRVPPARPRQEQRARRRTVR